MKHIMKGKIGEMEWKCDFKEGKNIKYSYS